MNRTKIEYLTHSWSPIAMRCTPVSEGCANCWHLAMANRLAANRAFPPGVRDAYTGEGPPVLIKHRLDEPLRRKRPATIGVQFMGDLFHEDVPFEFVHQIFDVMQKTVQHIFQVLTKRPKRMLDFLNIYRDWPGRDWPYSNIYLGVSVENQATADGRTPQLLRIPAAVRFVSGEPLLGPVDLTKVQVSSMEVLNALTGESMVPHSEPPRYPGLDWVICGGESGPGARPLHPDWARSLRDQCQAAGVPFFFKQWGKFAPESHWQDFSMAQRNRKGAVFSFRDKRFPQDQRMYSVGKRAAGRLLDGRTWDEFPERQ